MSTRRIEVGDLGFSVLDEGEGPAAVLLHGFPDTSSVWRKQIPALVSAGYRAIAPDLRGRGDSDMPERVEDYALPLILQDVTGIMDALGIEKATIVGHDWGAAVAWLLAAFVPQRVDRLVAISVGHPRSFSRFTADQLQKSWYMWIFQFEGVAEELFTKDDWRIFRDWLASERASEHHIEALSKPGRFTAGLNWYRANVTPQSLIAPRPDFPPVPCPVLAIMGARDIALGVEQMENSREFVSGPWQYEVFDDAGHWVQLEHPGRVNQLILDFMKRSF